jgi:23S rRNA (adenine2503-C2)-methyltransferase
VNTPNAITSNPDPHPPAPRPSPPAPQARPDIQGSTQSEVDALLRSWNQPGYRATQVLEWVHRQLAPNWETMTNLPRALRTQLDQQYHLRPLELVQRQGASDTTQKFLWRLHDRHLIESVLIPANPALYGQPSDRHTLCVSTQVGCAYGCAFCASGLDGWKRNLDAAEIVGQVLAAERLLRSQPVEAASSLALEPPGPAPRGASSRFIHNLVIMGMGEPLANYEQLLRALRILNAPWGGTIGARKITISTSGLVPQIQRLADEPEQFGLAISLHGATDDVRSRIMPVNRKYPIAELTEACELYQRKKGRMLTFEYILIAGINDHPSHAVPLGRLARRLHAKINLIPYNHVEGLSWERPTEAVQEQFLHALESQRVTATLRREKGHDIDAACGQLRLRSERDTPRV